MDNEPVRKIGSKRPTVAELCAIILDIPNWTKNTDDWCIEVLGKKANELSDEELDWAIEMAKNERGDDDIITEEQYFKMVQEYYDSKKSGEYTGD